MNYINFPINMVYYRRKTRLCWTIVCSLGMTWAIFYLFDVIYVGEQKQMNVCLSSKRQDNEKVKYIFNLDRWRGLMLNDRTYFVDNPKLWCDIPSELRMIADGICRMYNLKDCKRLPCQMIYSSPNTTDDVKCFSDGRVWKQIDGKSFDIKSDILCKRSFSLDLFVKKCDDCSYPSLIGDAFTPLSDKFYIDILNNHFRSCDSIWGLTFNFESITNYPWTADQNKLKQFDITFGYDRSLYDFIPPPWLFNYLEQIKFNSKRLSIQTVIEKKKSIHSTTTSDIYWTNTQTISSARNEKNDSSCVTAPILWMNTNCNTPSKRTEYINQLIKFIDIDNYGTCGKNILQLPEHIVQIQNSNKKNLKDRGTYHWEEGKLALSSEYLFTIAIENSINHDYITEKLWHALVAGSVPIYLGAPNIQDWLPCRTNCIIDLTKFETPKEAARYIKSVAMNKTLYQTYHQWRNEPITKQFEKMINYMKTIGDYSLDCILCHTSHRVGQGENLNNIKTKLKQTIGKF